MKFAQKLGITPEHLETKFSVTIPSGDVMSSTRILKSCQILIDGQEMFADLMIIRIKDFDVVLNELVIEIQSQYRLPQENSSFSTRL